MENELYQVHKAKIVFVSSAISKR